MVHQESRGARLTGSMDSHRLQSHSSQADGDLEFASARGDTHSQSSSWSESPTATPRLPSTTNEVLLRTMRDILVTLYRISTLTLPLNYPTPFLHRPSL